MYQSAASTGPAGTSVVVCVRESTFDGGLLNCKAEKAGDARNVFMVAQSGNPIYAEMWSSTVTTNRVNVNWMVQAV